MRKTLVNILLPIVVFILPFAVYLYTLSPEIAPGDSTEMVTVAIVLGVPHQPSYPVNTLLGYLGSKLPVPLSDVQRVNAVSSFLQALTAVTFYFLIINLFKFVYRKKDLSIGFYLVSTVSSMFLAFSLIYWKYATKFEVFPLNNLLVVVLLLMAVKLGLVVDSRRKSKKRLLKHTNKAIEADWKLVGLAFLGGFALTHHQTVVLIIPALFYLLWSRILGVLRSPAKIIMNLTSLILGTVPFFALLLWIASRKPLLNWGEVNTISEAFMALVRKDFGVISSFLVGFEPTVRPAPIQHIAYYLRNLAFDFSIVGVLFGIVGIIFLAKNYRRLLWFVTLGFIMSGFVFLSYANFPLSDTFNQATVRRFHMLPNIFFAIYLAFGLYFLYLKVHEIRVKRLGTRLGLLIGKLFLLATFIFPLFMNFSKTTHKGNDLTLRYTLDAYASTPENAIVLLSGDIPNMTMDYYRFVELAGEDERITFSPGQFHLDWFTDQLVRDYPDLEVPLPKAGKYFTTTTQIVEANYGKWPIYVGPDLVVHDPELEQKYILYPKHLLFLVKEKGEDLKLEEWREENDKLWESLDLELMKSIKRNSPMFEETIIFHYVRHFFNVGFVYEDVGLYEDAIGSYKRVLEIDPFFKEALAGLSRVYGEKMDPVDYGLAIDYLQKYQSVLRPEEGDFAYAAQAKIYEYLEKAQKEAESFDEAQDKEAVKVAEIEGNLPAGEAGMEATPSGETEEEIVSEVKEE